MRSLICLLLLVLVSTSAVYGQVPSISLDNVVGTFSGDTVVPGGSLSFNIRLSNLSGAAITTNGFRVYSPDNATWTGTIASETGAITDAMIGNRFTNLFSADGTGADTVGFGGFRIFEPGIANGFDEVAWTIGVGPIGGADDGKTICLDSSFYTPAGLWKWSTPAGDVFPNWSGKRCFSIVDTSVTPNNPPVLSPIGPKEVIVGEFLYFSVFATDPDGEIPSLAVTSGMPPGAYFADSGDGTGYFSWTPDYASAGNYQVTFRASDAVGAADSETVPITVVSGGGGGAEIISVVPDSATQGEGLWVTITGQNTHFGMGSGTTTSALLERQLETISASIVQVTSPTVLSAYFSIPVNASTGQWHVVVNVPGYEVATLVNGFTVLPAQQPQLAYVWPDSGIQGQSMWVDIAGQNTHFLSSSSTTVRLRSGANQIYLNSFNIFADTFMTAFLPIPGNAPPGLYDLDYIGSYENLTLVNAFEIFSSAPAPELVAMYPNHGRIGDSLWVDIIGRNTHFTQASSTYAYLAAQDTIELQQLILFADTLIKAFLPINPFISTGYKDLILFQDNKFFFLNDAFRVDAEVPACSLGVQPQMVDFYLPVNSGPDSQLVFVSTDCPGVDYYTTDTVSWLAGHPVTGHAPDSMWVVVYPTGLPPATYGGPITLINSAFIPGIAEVYVRMQIYGDTINEYDFSLDHVSGLTPLGNIPDHGFVTFHIRQNNGANATIWGLTNAFSISSPNGAFWNSTEGDTTGANIDGMLDQFFITNTNVDGHGADTVGFGGFRIFGPGIPGNFNDIVYSLTIGPIDTVSRGKTICLDSAFYPPAGVWNWSTAGSDYIPSWDGPHCFEVESGGSGFCNISLSTDHIEFNTNAGNDPPCQYFDIGTSCAGWTQHDSTWYIVDSLSDPWIDSTSIYVDGSMEKTPDTVIQQYYRICTNVGNLPPGHYHDTLWIYVPEALNSPQYVVVNLTISSDSTQCGSDFAGYIWVADSSGYAVDTGAVMGTRHDATDGFDPGIDRLELGFPMPPELKVYFSHPEYGVGHERLTADFRAPINGGCKYWPLVIETPFWSEWIVALNLWNINAGSEYSFNLLSPAHTLLKEGIDLSAFVLTADAGRHEFLIEACCQTHECHPSYFTNYVETGRSYSYVLMRPPICGDLQRGDEIGLFDRQQGRLVGGFAYCGQPFPLAIPAWKSDPAHNLPGYIPGNDLELKIYKRADNAVICTNVDGQCLNFEACTYGTIMNIDCAPCNDGFCASFPIYGFRWHLLSTPVLPLNPNYGECDVSNVFGNLGGLEIVENDDGQAYIPAIGINDIGCVNVCEGYNIYRKGEKDTLCVSGSPMATGKCMVRPGRWNMIGYPLLCELPVDFALSSITGCIDVLMDDDGRVYIPNPQVGVNTIGNLIPGKGYYLFLSCESGQEISWPPCYDTSVTAKSSIPLSRLADSRTTQYKCESSGLPYPVLLQALNDVVEPGDEIGLFDQGLCVGAAVYQNESVIAIPAWRADPAHNLAGFTAGHPIEIRIMPMGGSEFTLMASESSTLKFGEGSYTLVDVSREMLLPTEYSLSQNYPNPFNPTTVIEFALPEPAKVSIGIYNILGRQVKELVNAQYRAGRYEIAWDGTDANSQAVSTGIYFYRIRANDFVQSKKMMLMK